METIFFSIEAETDDASHNNNRIPTEISLTALVNIN